MNRCLKLLFLGIFSTSLSLSACSPASKCTDALGCVTVGASDPVVIAAVFPFTGDERVTGSAAYQAVKQAAIDQEYVLGHWVDVIREDYNCSAGNNQETAARLTGNDQIIAIIGPTCAADDPQFNQAIADAGILHLVLADPPAPDVPGGDPIPLSAADPQNEGTGSLGDSPASLAYDGARLVFAAIEKAGSGSTQKKLIIPRQALRQTVLSINNLEGRSGLWTCTVETGCTVKLENP